MLTENEQARLLWLLACGHKIQFKISRVDTWAYSKINYQPQATRFDIILKAIEKGLIYRIADHVFPPE